MAAEDLVRTSFKTGEGFVAERDGGEEALVIDEGSVEISISEREAELNPGVLKSGQIIGEMAVIDSSPRVVTAHAAR